MTPEQLKTIRGFIERLMIGADAGDANVAAIACSDLEEELSHYVRVPDPTPASERRCGGCARRVVCATGAREDEPAAYCLNYSDGALPDGIAAVVRAAIACRDGDGCSDDGDAELLESVDALTEDELAMAGVKGGERG